MTKIPLVDSLLRSSRRTLAIQVYPDGKVVVRAPVRALGRDIARFVESKRDWILQKKAQAAQTAPAASGHLQGGESLPFLGKDYPLQVVESQRAALFFQDGFFLRRSELPAAAALLRDWYAKTANTLIPPRVEKFAQTFGLHYNKIAIRSARTRWGSCSSAGNLNFNWRLLMAPPPAMDYVILHELAHLLHPNHSPAFWAQVQKMMPEYQTHRLWFKQNGAALMQKLE